MAGCSYFPDTETAYNFLEISVDIFIVVAYGKNVFGLRLVEFRWDVECVGVIAKHGGFSVD